MQRTFITSAFHSSNYTVERFLRRLKSTVCMKSRDFFSFFFSSLASVACYIYWDLKEEKPLLSNCHKGLLFWPPEVCSFLSEEKETKVRWKELPRKFYKEAALRKRARPGPRILYFRHPSQGFERCSRWSNQGHFLPAIRLLDMANCLLVPAMHEWQKVGNDWQLRRQTIKSRNNFTARSWNRKGDESAFHFSRGNN